ncbi:hypothetical protein Zmor_001569 [Zophobas morio]|uniref:Ricin B lectin domain-containing protein n=1 Tax=Zophobas morio TaxID=2755281 RepID=A0AA38MSH5_9CUCU|nr:hypothetical protein Zmor_001569 [Zophobas morio]
MTAPVVQSICLCFLITFVSTQTCYDNKWFTIRSLSTGLAVDGRDPAAIMLKNFDGSIYQQWKFEIGYESGSYYVMNRASGNVLDMHADEKYVTTTPLDCPGYDQIWCVFGDGRFAYWHGGNLMAENDYVVDGARLGISANINATITQAFVVEEYLCAELEFNV